jgi:DNA-binding FadR family transcriptional regulator
MRKLGVSRNGKRNALSQLREAGLIAVEERPRKSPIITVRFVD